jgi:hypothetical protein
VLQNGGDLLPPLVPLVSLRAWRTVLFGPGAARAWWWRVGARGHGRSRGGGGREERAWAWA